MPRRTRRGDKRRLFPPACRKACGLSLQSTAGIQGRTPQISADELSAGIPSDAYLKEIAEYFASLRPPFPPPAVPTVSKEILARGESLVKNGDAASGVPACARCHNPGFTGMEPAIPGLLGLRAAYISAQLGGWRYGTRTAAAPDCMQIVASLLTEDDVKAVAAYLSSLPAPADPSFAPKGSLPMPLACGSEPN